MAELPDHNIAAPPIQTVQGPAPEDIVKILDAYRVEGQNARDAGDNPRTPIWESNVNRYWGRHDMTKKASWQSQLVLPVVPQYVDRWSAAMREALEAQDKFFTVEDEAGSGRLEPLIPHIERVMKVLLGRCSRTPDGHLAPFGSVFEEQMKLGAMMALSASVSWKTDTKGGWVAVESVDPREVWYDPKGRNLYRRRRYEIDKHELVAMAARLDEVGLPIYNIEQVMQLGAQVDSRSTLNRNQITGSDSGTDQGRKPIVIDEWIATVILDDGQVAADRSLMIQANEKFLIRGPEKNPYWHDTDWLVYSPMISVPLSIYGRTYMEEWAPTADAYIEMTNLILDAVQTSAMKAYVVQASMLANPTQLAEGISPNKVFMLDEGVAVADFIKEIELGVLPPEVTIIWQSLKNELQEGAKLNEISMGQLPDKTHISAAASTQAGMSGSAMMRSIAKTIEQRWLEPVLTLVWETALQYMDFASLANEIGPETAQMLNAQRAEFQSKKIKFRVRGISGLLDRQAKLQNFLQFSQVVGQNPMLLQAFMQKTNFPRLLQTLLVWLGIDPAQFEYTPQELMQQQLQTLIGTPGEQPGQPPGGQGQPAQQQRPQQ